MRELRDLSERFSLLIKQVQDESADANGQLPVDLKVEPGPVVNLIAGLRKVLRQFPNGDPGNKREWCALVNAMAYLGNKPFKKHYTVDELFVAKAFLDTVLIVRTQLSFEDSNTVKITDTTQWCIEPVKREQTPPATKPKRRNIDTVMTQPRTLVGLYLINGKTPNNNRILVWQGTEKRRAVALVHGDNTLSA